MVKIREKIREWKRIIEVARKPTKDEFVLSSKICAVGLALIGIIGLIIFIAFILIGI
jgi:protein transport protein SEC61 subunit gamma-like protein